MPEGTRSLAALMRGLIDYAGLFPPSAHTMMDAVARYAAYRTGPNAVALGRFVVPAARLMEWEQAVAALPADARGVGRWRLTALAAAPLRKDLAAIVSFNERESTGRDFQAQIESVEVKVATADDVRQTAPLIPPGLEVFYECPVDSRLDAVMAEIQACGGGAKIRTGGLVPDAIAPPETVASFIAACAARGLPYKATAGLHHPVRAVHALTYEPGAPRAMMNGFLNVFVAGVLALSHHLNAAQLQPILEETSPAAFVFSDAAVRWRALSATPDEIAATRSQARGFGSCSFDEPINELKTLGACL
jgi:hypothetical protein